MTQYVLGFLFHQNQVALILKKRGPDVVVGKWNGIGGKVESGEEPPQAMVREFREETGLVLEVPWIWYCDYHMHRYQAEIHCFYARLNPTHARPLLIQMTDELVSWHTYKRLHKSIVVPNLHWIIGLALDPDRPSAINVY